MLVTTHSSSLSSLLFHHPLSRHTHSLIHSLSCAHSLIHSSSFNNTCTTLYQYSLPQTFNHPLFYEFTLTSPGTSRDHVGPLLEVLVCVIDGLTMTNDRHIPLLREVIKQVLIPLHRPDEMVEWRDQIPVLQRYHEPLVMCLVAVIEKSRSTRTRANSSTSFSKNIGATGDVPSSSLIADATTAPIAAAASSSSSSLSSVYSSDIPTLSPTLFVDIITGIIAMWPSSFSANTPKVPPHTLSIQHNLSVQYFLSI